jgi:hypothetical protein
MADQGGIVTEMHPDEGAVQVPSIFKRLVDVFLRPAELFDTLRERPVWGGALVLGAVFVVASMWLIPAEVWTEMLRAQMADQPAAAEALEGVGATLMRVFAVGGGLVFWAVWIFLVAGIATLVFAFFMGDEGKFKQYLAVTSHALLIAAVGGLLITPLRIAQADPQLTLSIGTFLPAGESYLHRFLSGLDLFMIWGYVVLAMGASRIDTRRSVMSATVVMMLFVLVTTALFALAPRPG